MALCESTRLPLDARFNPWSVRCLWRDLKLSHGSELLTVDSFQMKFFLIFRFICCPHKLHFFRSVFNIIDIFCVIPMLIVFVLELSDPLFWDTQQFFLIITYVSLTSVLRVFRLFKLARHYRYISHRTYIYGYMELRGEFDLRLNQRK